MAGGCSIYKHNMESNDKYSYENYEEMMQRIGGFFEEKEQLVNACQGQTELKGDEKKLGTNRFETSLWRLRTEMVTIFITLQLILLTGRVVKLGLHTSSNRVYTCRQTGYARVGKLGLHVLSNLPLKNIYFVHSLSYMTSEKVRLSVI